MKQQLSNLQLIYQVFGATWTWTFDVEHHMIVKRGLTAWELALAVSFQKGSGDGESGGSSES